MRTISFYRLALLALVLVAGVAPATGQEVALHLVKTGTFAEDLYLAGERIEFRGEADGDLAAAAARSLSIEGLVRGDVAAVAGSVFVAGRVLDDVRVAGQLVVIAGEVGDGLLAAGEVVRITTPTRVGGSAWILGRRVDVSGQVRRELRVAAVRVRIGGTVEGDVYLAARDIEILPTARITGSLTYWSSQEARIAPEAHIAGRVIQRQPEFLDRAGRVLTVVGLVTRALVVVNLFASGVVLFLLFPRFTVAAARTVGLRRWASLGTGLAVLVLTPLAALLLALTVIAIPLALGLAALYVLALWLGFIIAAFALGDLAARAFRRGTRHGRGARIGWLALAVLALALVRFVPVVGPLVLLVAIALGVGAWTLRLSRGYLGIPEEEGVLP
jgi:cytoskeletal protein CcmA (bactofilin family)